MNIEKFTEKSEEAIKESINIAIKQQNQFVTPLHLLSAIISLDDSVIQNLIEKSGGKINNINQDIKTELQKIPSVSGESVQSTLSQEYNALLIKAEELSTKSNDSFVTIERLFQALAISSNKASEILKHNNLDVLKLNQAIKDYRNGRIADSKTSEDTFESLKKFTQDLTKRAKEGKLDNVVGRDKELERCISRNVLKSI